MGILDQEEQSFLTTRELGLTPGGVSAATDDAPGQGEGDLGGELTFEGFEDLQAEVRLDTAPFVQRRVLAHDPSPQHGV
jgi:hypothetical protein